MLNRSIGCFVGGCLVPVAVLVIAIAVIKYVLTTPDLNGMEGALVVAAVLIVAAIAFYGHHSHWTT